MQKKRVLLVDDHPIFRHGLAQIINEEADLMVCGQLESIGDAVSQMDALSPDIAIVDLTLKNRSGLDLIRDIRDHWPNVFVLVVSMHDEALFAERVRNLSAKGYVDKNEPPSIIVKAIWAILNGDQFWDGKQVKESEIVLTPDETSGTDIQSILSDREFEIFQLIANGLKPKDIAKTLILSVNTVERHRTNLRKKLNLNSSSELTQFAIEWSRTP